MIGKPEWFGRRKYTGWGIVPKTWQGWVYIALVIVPFMVFQAIPIWSTQIRIIATLIWALFLLVDVGHIMIKLGKDERESKHEAIAERNALWAVMIVLVAGIGYEIAQSSVKKMVVVDPFIIAALVAALVVKAISNFYLDRKD